MKKRRISWDSSDEEDSSSSDESSEEEEESCSSVVSSSSSSPFTGAPLSVTTAPPRVPLHTVPPTQCRQCPNYTGPLTTSDSSYRCTVTSNHVLCMCCHLPMPDRRNDTDLSVPPQKCDICSKAFCHMYWGCSKLGCSGCLNLFKDTSIDDSLMNTILCNNSHESRILKNYLQEKGLSISDMMATCLDKLDSGSYQAPDTRSARINSNTRTCYSCAVKNIKELVYQYRTDIAHEDLPSAVTSRPNCHWGRNCRTQAHNRIHAENYNHICSQTRF